MLTRLFIALLVLSGSYPIRICTCAAENEPLVSAVGDADDPCDHDCDCPVMKPVSKVAVAPAELPTELPLSIDLLTTASELEVSPTRQSLLNLAPEPVSATPLYLTLRTLRN